MARFTGSKAKVNRRFGEPIMGYTKSLEKKSYPPGMHGQSRKKKQPSEYATQLKEKQKAKMTYGLLERQFARFYNEAVRKKGVTGENLLKLLEARLDNTVFRLGVAPTRRAARQLVAHKHITVNGRIAGIPSLVLRAGDVISIKEKSKGLPAITQALGNRESKYPWLEWNSDTLKGIFLAMPEKDQIPENIHEQLIVELYSK
ncbi:MAG TPA: 30S ribosomal protein S4 [Chitinophagales bacterium]|nr:30S ribosomal protein S4 [Chitinophagales bacterium]